MNIEGIKEYARATLHQYKEVKPTIMFFRGEHIKMVIFPTDENKKTFQEEFKKEVRDSKVDQYYVILDSHVKFKRTNGFRKKECIMVARYTKTKREVFALPYIKKGIEGEEVFFFEKEVALTSVEYDQWDFYRN
jgi:hypothetical protein